MQDKKWYNFVLLGTRDLEWKRFANFLTNITQMFIPTCLILTLNFIRYRNSGWRMCARRFFRKTSTSGPKQISIIDMRKLLRRKNSWSRWTPWSQRYFDSLLPSVVSSYFSILILSFSLILANKGVSADLLKTGSKRRRTKQQIEDEKKAAIIKEQQNAARLAQYDIL